jgi:hypothetical protein
LLNEIPKILKIIVLKYISADIIYRLNLLILRRINMASNAKSEKFSVKGEDLIKKVKDIIKEGNARRIIITDKSDKTLIEVPLTIGVVGAVLAPVLAAVGAIAALVTECTITVEKK